MKIYNDISEAIQSGLFQHSDILVFWGKRGKGKSSLQAAFNVQFMQPKNAKSDLKLSRSICNKVNNAGFDINPPDDHLVFVDTFCQSAGFGLKNRTAYQFDALDFGLPNNIHPTGLLCPCGKYSFDEAQDLFDSHMGALATFVSKGMELSRQPELFLMIAVQRPKRLPLDIRDIATFIECVDRQNVYNKYGRLIKTIWTCNIIYENANLESYLLSRESKHVDKTVKFVFEGNIYNCYDSRYFLPMFYRHSGLKTTSLTLEHCKRVEYSASGLEDYHKRHTIDIPDTYRGKKQTKKEVVDVNNRKKAPGI